MILKRIMIFICTIYVFAGIVIMYFSNSDKINTLIESYKLCQNELLDYIKASFEEMPDEYIENPEELDKIFNFKYTYGFVYRDNVVIYERDMETTEKYKNSTARELFNDYAQIDGSNNADDVMNILLEDSGTTYVQKTNNESCELISWRSISKNDNYYVIGIAIPVNTVLEVSNYKKYITIDILMYIFSCIVVVALSAFICVRENNKNK